MKKLAICLVIALLASILISCEETSTLPNGITPAPAAPTPTPAPASTEVHPSKSTVESLENEFDYVEKNNGVILTKYLGSAVDVSIPDELGGLPVVEIGASAFANSNIEAVDMPNSITRIGEAAFANCKQLSYVNLSTGLLSVEGRAFYNCDILTDLKFSEGLKEIYGSAIGTDQYKYYLADVYIPASTEKIYGDFDRAIIETPTGSPMHQYAEKKDIMYFNEVSSGYYYCVLEDYVDIQRCPNESTIEIPSSYKGLPVKRIKGGAIRRGEKVVIPYGVEIIDRWAFYGNENLKHIEIPGTVKKVEDILRDCNNIQTIKVNAGSEVIGTIGNTHVDLTKLVYLHLPRTVEKISCSASLKLPRKAG